MVKKGKVKNTNSAPTEIQSVPVTSSTKLNERQMTFCREYLIDLNATQAAIRAGYSEKTAFVIGWENLKKPYIQAFISEERKKLTNKLELSQEWVLTRFKEISDRCMTAEPVMVRDTNGNLIESGEWEFDSNGANKSTEMIGKHLGFFESDNKQKTPPLIQAPMTDDQVDRLISSLRENKAT
jgi:phage terminase small subunit